MAGEEPNKNSQPREGLGYIPKAVYSYDTSKDAKFPRRKLGVSGNIYMCVCVSAYVYVLTSLFAIYLLKYATARLITSAEKKRKTTYGKYVFIEYIKHFMTIYTQRCLSMLMNKKYISNLMYLEYIWKSTNDYVIVISIS